MSVDLTPILETVASAAWDSAYGEDGPLWADLDMVTRRYVKEGLLPTVVLAAEAVEARLREVLAREIRLIDEQHATGKVARPLRTDAEVPTDFANDFEWAARLVEGSL